MTRKSVGSWTYIDAKATPRLSFSVAGAYEMTPETSNAKTEQGPLRHHWIHNFFQIEAFLILISWIGQSVGIAALKQNKTKNSF